ncbi:MAG: membrane protein insertase YidC [Betaproteobacteria bacterium]|nr:membrane protein insertase YidC [Betaproteobacteria bacterium]
MDVQRLLLLIVFSFSSVMLWQSWEKAHNPVAVTQSVSANSTTSAPTSSGLTDNNLSTITFPVGQQTTVRTDVLTAKIDANGGDLRSLILTKYHETGAPDQPLQLFEQDAGHLFVAQSGLIGDALPTHKSVFRLAATQYTLQPGQDTLTVPLFWSDPTTGLQVEKDYIFHRNSYRVDVTWKLNNTGTLTEPVNAYFQFVRDNKQPPGESRVVHTYTGPALYTQANKFTKLDFKKLDKGEQDYPKYANNGWVAMVQHHFVSVWLPEDGLRREFYVNALGNGLYKDGVIVPEAALAPHSHEQFTVPMYAGPQIQNVLTALAPGLDYVVDYGWLTPIAVPIFWLLQKIHGVVGNWGWSIVVLTILIKLMFFPLSAKSYRSMAQMRGLSPKLKQLKELHGDDKEKHHLAMMELYKTEKVNPLGGCLPTVVQIPVFIALYWTLVGSVEMRQAPFIGWIHDLSAPDPFFVLPILMGITMLLQTRLNPAPPDPMQAKVMMVMPIAFTFFFMFFPSGLVLYWVVNNLFSMTQQWVITRKVEAEKIGSAAH